MKAPLVMTLTARGEAPGGGCTAPPTDDEDEEGNKYGSCMMFEDDGGGIEDGELEGSEDCSQTMGLEGSSRISN